MTIPKDTFLPSVIQKRGPLYWTFSFMSRRSVFFHYNLGRPGNFLPKAFNQCGCRLHVFPFIDTTSTDIGVAYFLVHVLTAWESSKVTLTLREARVHLSHNGGY